MFWSFQIRNYPVWIFTCTAYITLLLVAFPRGTIIQWTFKWPEVCFWVGRIVDKIVYIELRNTRDHERPLKKEFKYTEITDRVLEIIQGKCYLPCVHVSGKTYTVHIYTLQRDVCVFHADRWKDWNTYRRTDKYMYTAGKTLKKNHRKATVKYVHIVLIFF